jgi:beta-glucanase (GH16 family)
VEAVSAVPHERGHAVNNDARRGRIGVPWLLVTLVAVAVGLVADTPRSSPSGGPARTTTALRAAARVAPPDARLVFADDFAGPGLDAQKWITCYPWANPSGCNNKSSSELEWYQPSGVSVSASALHLTARRQQVMGDKRYDFTSGMVATAGRFQFTYGYVEFRARVPSGQGLWSTLWLLPADQSWPPEIDVAEVLGGDPTVAALTYHPPHGHAPQRRISTADLSAGWHVFAVDWRPGSISWFMDGQPNFRVTSDVPRQPMYLLADLAIGGAQAPNNATLLPASLDLDFVRVWQPG